jgi:hypothetical protein
LACDEQLALIPSFRHFYFQLSKRRFEMLDLSFLIDELVREGLGHLTMTEGLLNRCARKDIISFTCAQLRPPQKIGTGLLVLDALLLQQMLVRNRDRNLSLHLHQLILHIEQNLLQHLLRIFRAIDQVIQIRTNQAAHTFEQAHGITSP